eukprot:5433713-Lingulodinium_polyedra.AAC.1
MRRAARPRRGSRTYRPRPIAPHPARWNRSDQPAVRGPSGWHHRAVARNTSSAEAHTKQSPCRLDAVPARSPRPTATLNRP